MILYRSVGLKELELIYDSGMKAFPARLPQQPIFYPVLQLEYARQIASEWNAESGQSAGYVTQFKVEDQYIGKFEVHTVGVSQHQEFWIPAEGMEEFNRHIVGHIKVVEAYFGDEFQGFVPDKFGLQGKTAAEQFTLLTNTYIYKRLDFYLEIKRNHKAVFLNYPFWQKYQFKNEALKEKVIQAIKEAWLTSFPKIPLPAPPPLHEDTPPVRQPDAYVHAPRLEDAVDEDIDRVEQTGAQSYSAVDPNDEEITPAEQTESDAWLGPDDRDVTSVKQPETDARPLANSSDEDTSPGEQPEAQAHFAANLARESVTPASQTESHFERGVRLGLSGRYQEAIGELSRAVEENPEDVVAQTSLGIAFHRLDEDDRALSCYERALKIDPIYAEAHYFRANILYSQGNVREAITAYTVAIGLKPELIEAHQRLLPQDRLTDYTHSPAEMYWIARPAHQILDLNKSLETNPGQASLFKERATAYYRLRNYVQAIADYGSSLEIQPQDANVFHLRGMAYEQIGQSDRAQEDYQRAIVINPQLSDVYINRGVTFGRMGHYRQSIASLTEAIRLAPRNPDGYFNRATAYLQQSDFVRAIDDFSDVIRLSPGDEEAYYWRGISNEAAGRLREAIADYRQFLAISQNPQAKKEIEQKLNRLSEAKRNDASNRSVVSEDRQGSKQPSSKEPEQDLDVHGLIVALGKRAINSTWFGSGVQCSGEKAEELYALTKQNKPIEGRALLQITSGIRQTVEGDFQAFDAGAASPWIFIRAWGGKGFYVETNDPKIKERLQTHFKRVEEVEGASPPYESLFITSDRTST